MVDRSPTIDSDAPGVVPSEPMQVSFFNIFVSILTLVMRLHRDHNALLQDPRCLLAFEHAIIGSTEEFRLC